MTGADRPAPFDAIGLSAVGLLSLAAGWLIADERVPLGVLGEWVWNRSAWPSAWRVAIAMLACIVYIAFVLAGRAWLARHGERWVALWLAGPVLLGLGLQYAWLSMPASPGGLERWPIALESGAVSGYFTQARSLDDLPAFLADYEQWVARQDVYHIGTHPPGLIALNRAALTVWRGRPSLAERWLRLVPSRFADGLRAVQWQDPTLSASDLAALTTMALGTWLMSLLTAPVLYLLARQVTGAESSWLSAGCWPLVPVGVLFLPLADCVYPMLSVSAVALAVRARKTGTVWPTLLAGMLLALALTFSLAFLAVTVMALAVLALLESGLRRSGRVTQGLALIAGAIVAIGAASLIGLNLPAVWATNLAKHAQFYQEMPRSYGAWLWVNAIEFAVGVGPVLVWLSLRGAWSGRLAVRRGPQCLLTAWLAVLVLLDLSGRNLGEVARLWLLLAPFACLGLGSAWEGSRASARSLAGWLACQALLATLLVARVEPLLPIAGGR